MFFVFFVEDDRLLMTGSKAGIVMLYSSKNITRAITSFPSIYLNILDIDVTFNGKWILGKIENKLLLFNIVGLVDTGDFKKTKQILVHQQVCKQ